MNRATVPTGWARNPDGTPGYTWNPITGCLNHVNGLCKGGNFPCYAYRLANGRLKARYLANKEVAINGFDCVYIDGKDPKYSNPFYPRFWPERLDNVAKKYSPMPKNLWKARKPRGIFCCDMSDLFGIGVPEDWTRRVLNIIDYCCQDRFYLLTKQPQNLAKFSPFPDNCWVGVTVCNDSMMQPALNALMDIEAKTTFISFEPLLTKIDVGGIIASQSYRWLDWLIIGALTGTKADLLPLHRKTSLAMIRDGKKWILAPQIEWVREIIEAADKAGIPVFLKDNLGWPSLSADGGIPFYKKHPSGTMELRQEALGTSVS